MTYRFAAIVLLILSSSHVAIADTSDTSYADEDWFPIDDQHYMAVAATADTDMVLHMRTITLDPSSPVEAMVALRNNPQCMKVSNTDSQDWKPEGTVTLNKNTVEGESRCEGYSRLYRPRFPEGTKYMYELITSDRPITVQVGAAHGKFDNVNGKEAWEDLHTRPDGSTIADPSSQEEVLPDIESNRSDLPTLQE